jgi:hypothetical protein
MIDDRFSLLVGAIRRREMVSFRIGGSVHVFRPYALYDLPSGVLMLAGLTAYRVALAIPVTELESLALAGRNFDPDPVFDLADPKYRDAHAPLSPA